MNAGQGVGGAVDGVLADVAAAGRLGNPGAAGLECHPAARRSIAVTLPLRIGSEMSSNEAIKHMCAAGFGVAFLSMHTCVLEIDAGLLQLLPLADNPVEREWFVMHLASRQLPQVSAEFERFLVREGQQALKQQLHEHAAPAPGAGGATAKAAGARARKGGDAGKAALANADAARTASRRRGAASG